jgi:hypothetical protein
MSVEDVRLLGKGGMAMFEKERFVEECRAALRERDAHAVVRELVARAVSEPMQIVRGLGEPGVQELKRSTKQTI